MAHPLFLAAGGVSEITRQFGVTWPQFAAQALSFGIIALLLHRFAYKPILQVLEVRQQRIAESLASAEKIKQQLVETEARRHQTLTEAGAQASRIIEEARAAAERELAKRTQEAIAAANLIISKAREANEAELARMKAELRKEVGRLVVQTTAKVAGKVLTLEDQQRLAAETNQQLVA
jgi:F-type H+-transporting ATPase subunit b